MRPHLAFLEQLLQAGPQQAPLVEVLLTAVAAVDDDAAHAAPLQQGLVDREVSDVGHDLVALGVAQRLRLLGRVAVERQRGIRRIAGERVRRQGIR